jgi:membrane-associated phospholipid phosphatase
MRRAGGGEGTLLSERSLAVRLFSASAAALGATVICYLVMVHTALGQRFDQAAYFGATQDPSPHAGTARDLLHQITGWSLVVVLLLLIGCGLVRRRPLLGIGAALAAGGTVLIAEILKHYIFTRADLSAQGSASGNTFPSGHTATAAACAMALVIVCPPRWRGVVALLGGSYAGVVAVQVQVVGWHRPSDAIGGAFIAFALTSLAAGIFAWFHPLTTDRTSGPLSPYVILALVVVGAAGLSAFGFVQGADALREGASHFAIRHGAYLTGLAVTIGAVAGLVMALLWLIRGVHLDTDRSLRGLPNG